MQYNMDMITLMPEIWKEKMKARPYTKSFLMEAKFTMTTYHQGTYILQRWWCSRGWE